MTIPEQNIGSKGLGSYDSREKSKQQVAGVATESSCLYPQAGGRERQLLLAQLFTEIDSSEIWGKLNVIPSFTAN